MRHQITSYFKFLLKSTNQHGVHSPFVFNLVTKCFYDKRKYEAYKNLSDYKNELLSLHNTIEVVDLGSGSHVSKTNTRKISSIAKHAGSTKKRSRLLYRFSAYFKPETVLELGTSLGIATYALHLGYPKSDITTIEGCPKITNFTKAYVRKFTDKNISFTNGDFKAVLPSLKQKFDIIYIDGNHTKEATLSYFETLLNNAHNDTVFIFDDIYWSQGMTEAWELIKKHPRVTVTINSYWCGFVFIRQEQAKEHFVIRL